MLFQNTNMVLKDASRRGTPIVKGVNTNETADEIHSSSGHETKDINSSTINLSLNITYEELARLIEAATDSLTKQLELLCDLMKDLCQAPPKIFKKPLA